MPSVTMQLKEARQHLERGFLSREEQAFLHGGELMATVISHLKLTDLPEILGPERDQFIADGKVLAEQLSSEAAIQKDFAWMYVEVGIKNTFRRNRHEGHSSELTQSQILAVSGELFGAFYNGVYPNNNEVDSKEMSLNQLLWKVTHRG